MIGQRAFFHSDASSTAARAAHRFFWLTEDGPEVAAILTARSQEKEQPIGLAVPVAPHTRTLTDALSTVEIAADGDT